MALPTLVVVSGPPGSGKTTLAHRIARVLGCPAICRDEIKEGMVHAHPGFAPSTSDPLTMRTFGTFFDVLGLLLKAGVTVVAEAAFQDKLWRPNLQPFANLADIRIVHCRVDADVAHDRIVRRLADNPQSRVAHADSAMLQERTARQQSHDAFVSVSLPVPAITVDTTDGYVPGVADLVAFVNRR